MGDFPFSIPTLPTQLQDFVDTYQASHVNATNIELTAVMSSLGVGFTGSFTNITSLWNSQHNPDGSHGVIPAGTITNLAVSNIASINDLQVSNAHTFRLERTSGQNTGLADTDVTWGVAAGTFDDDDVFNVSSDTLVVAKGGKYLIGTEVLIGAVSRKNGYSLKILVGPAIKAAQLLSVDSSDSLTSIRLNRETIVNTNSGDLIKVAILSTVTSTPISTRSFYGQRLSVG